MSSITYNGFEANIEFDADDQIFIGRIIGIRDVVGFHSNTVAGLEAAFRETVNDYVQATAELKSAP